MSALRKLIDSDLEHRSSILRRQKEVQAQYTYAKKAAEVFAARLATTTAVKDAFAASVLSTKALEEALKNTLILYDNHHQNILATISSKTECWRRGLKSWPIRKLGSHTWTKLPHKWKHICTRLPVSTRFMNPPILRLQRLCSAAMIVSVQWIEVFPKKGEY